jgi:hypothetical protein
LQKARVTEKAVSRRLPAAAARVRSWVGSYGIYGGQNDTGASFLRVLRFLLPILIPPMLHTHLSSGAGTKGQLVADVPSAIAFTQPSRNKN